MSAVVHRCTHADVHMIQARVFFASDPVALLTAFPTLSIGSATRATAPPSRLNRTRVCARMHMCISASMTGFCESANWRKTPRLQHCR
jgi:hypothetical protein